MGDNLKLRQEFISKLKAFKKALDYMDSEASTADKTKWQPRFCRMLKDLNDMEYQLRQSGIVMSDEEIHQLIENL
jgi:hypothetical protein